MQAVSVDGETRTWMLYGDAAYGLTRHIQCGFSKTERTRGSIQDDFSTAMNAPRTSVEWGFGGVTQTFPLIDKWQVQQVGRTPVGLYYHAAVLFTNALTCVTRGNQTSSYFNCLPPSIAEYLRE